MTAGKRERKSHLWDRDPDDFYIEPEDCSVELFKTLDFAVFNSGGNLDRAATTITDPACGTGRIVRAARAAGYHGTGGDLKPRWRALDNGADRYCIVFDFMAERWPFSAAWIVSNPPFKHCGMRYPSDPPPPFVARALDVASVGVALLLPLPWIGGATRSGWLAKAGLWKVLVVVPRPSMPPGAVILAGESPGGGEEDFAWFIFRKGHVGPWEGGWLRRNVSHETSAKVEPTSTK